MNIARKVTDDNNNNKILDGFPILLILYISIMGLSIGRYENKIVFYKDNYRITIDELLTRYKKFKTSVTTIVYVLGYITFLYYIFKKPED